MPRNLTTKEALQMVSGGTGKQTVIMMDVVDLNGEVRVTDASDNHKEILFLDGLEKIVVKHTEEALKASYYRILALMDKIGRRPGAMRRSTPGFNQFTVFIGPKGEDEFVYYNHDVSMMPKFRVDPDGKYLLSPGVTVKDAWESMRLTEEHLENVIRANNSSK